MFTGIIKAITTIEKSEMKDGSLFLVIKKPQGWKIQEGDSIATNGVCLTVKTVQEETYITELMQETLNKTTYGKEIFERVNVEQSLRLGDSLDGHLVFGHVDTVGTIDSVTQVDNSWVYKFIFDNQFAPLIAAKGSVSVDGISLTVVDAGDNWFTVSLVDYTYMNTTLGTKKAQMVVNLEFDMLARYTYRILTLQDKLK